VLKRSELTERWLERAAAAGRRWQDLSARRAETVRRLKAGGPAAAESPERVERYRRREAEKRIAMLRAGVTETAFTERRIGPTLDLDDNAPTDAALTAGHPVGRIVVLDDRNRVREGFATGFLLAPGLLITNQHVFASAGECEGCGVQFDYERLRGVLQAGVAFRLDPASFFHADETLDYAIVGVSSAAITGQALADYLSLPLDPMTGKILVGQPISIIQYPDGGPKKYGVRDNELLIPPEGDDLFLQYTTDTLPGSSGSPAFNKDWEVVAVHHSGVPEVKDGAIITIRGEPWRRGMPDADIHWVANEGARVSCVYQSLKELVVRPDHARAYAVLMRSFGEDFSNLPALQGPQETAAMDPLSAASRGVSIIVNGPGNFYFPGPGAAPLAAPLVAVAPALPAAPRPSAAREKKIVFDPDYDERRGYQADFLDIPVPHPSVSAGRLNEVLQEDTKPLVLKYHHYSLVMHKRRRTVLWAAVNADYTKKFRRKKRDDFGDDTWVPDPRILGKYQIMDQELYAPAAKFDRGHVIRRDDTAWGVTAKEEIFANSDSFHWTNCTPQHEAFNRDTFEYTGIGLWGMLENHIAGQARNVGNRMTIFAGPILGVNDIEHDFGGGTVLIPVRFWKIVIVAEDHGSDAARLAAFGFILDQSYAIEDYGIERTERFDPGEFETYQVSLAYITEESGVTFDDGLHAADALSGAPEESRRVRLTNVSDVRLGRGRR
jgi:endonuclease G